MIIGLLFIAGKSDDVIVSEVVKEISEKLPQNFDRLEAGADTLKDKEGFLDSLNVVLIQVSCLVYLYFLCVIIFILVIIVLAPLSFGKGSHNL